LRTACPDGKTRQRKFQDFPVDVPGRLVLARNIRLGQDLRPCETRTVTGRTGSKRLDDVGSEFGRITGLHAKV
jgi:hypothetical protein